MTPQSLALLVDITNQAAEICGRFQISTLALPIDGCQKLLAQGDTINVVVLGSFKAGKSSFLNVIAGNSVLPVGVVPVTAIITRLRFGEREQASVQFRDGSIRLIPIAEAGAFIIESKNPGNCQQVTDVLIETPALQRYQGLQFIDTPGLNSVFLHNSETSRNALPRVGAAFLAISVDHPLSEEDVKLLKDLLQATPQVVILLTKSDLLTPSQLAEVFGFVSKQIEPLSPIPIPIFPFSVQPAAGAGRERLDREVLFPLADQRRSAAARILHHKVKNIITDCLGHLNIGLAAAGRSQEDRSRLKNQILSGNAGLPAVAEELRLIEKHCVNQTRSLVAAIIQRHQPELHQRLATELGVQLATWHLNLWHLSREYEAWLKAQLAQEISALSVIEQTALAVPLQTAERKVARALENFKNALAADLERTLGVKLTPAHWEGTFQIPEPPPVRVSPAFDSQLDLLWFLIPMSVFGPILRRYFLRRVDWEVEKNLSRLTTQWTNAINSRIQALRQQGEEYVKSEIETIHGLLSQPPTVAAELAIARNTMLQSAQLLERWKRR